MNFEKILRLKGLPVDCAKKQLNEIKNNPDILDWQNCRKWEIFQYHYNNNKFYRNLFKSTPDSWNNIPILSKDNLNQLFKKHQNNANRYFVGKTSGSTGKTLQYSIDYFTHALTWSIIADRYSSLGLSLNDRQARFYGIHKQLLPRIIDRTKDYLANRYRMPIMDLGDASIQSWIKKIKEKRFGYIYGYSYPIITFAKYLKNNNQILKKICPDLKACIVTSEKCTSKEEELIQQSFGIPVMNEYGASELGIIGFGKANRWLVSDEQILVEIVDDNDYIVSDGETGRIICTNLFNKSTPFIRYEVGDMGCIITENGRRYLTQLHGRKEEMIQLPSEKRLLETLYLLFFIIKR